MKAQRLSILCWNLPNWISADFFISSSLSKLLCSSIFHISLLSSKWLFKLLVKIFLCRLAFYMEMILDFCRHSLKTCSLIFSMIQYLLYGLFFLHLSKFLENLADIGNWFFYHLQYFKNKRNSIPYFAWNQKNEFIFFYS